MGPSRLALLQERLDVLVRASDTPARRQADPVSFVHKYREPADQEVVGLLGSSLAFGNVVAVRKSIARALERLGDSPAAFVDRVDEKKLVRAFDGFVHRVYKGDDVAHMLFRAGRLRREHGSIGDAMQTYLAASDGDLREALARFADVLRGPTPTRGTMHLLPNPRAGSACKRLLLYLRWMVRRADGVDLGLWPMSPASLLIPVDTHVHRIGRNLGLTKRMDASWRTAEEITSVLRRFDPNDPVKYDFAICHMGVSRDCPSRRDPQRCEQCVLRSVCVQWKGSRISRLPSSDQSSLPPAPLKPSSRSRKSALNVVRDP